MTAFAFFALGYAAALVSMAIIVVALMIRAPTIEEEDFNAAPQPEDLR